jgi:hypothetical protein
MPIQMFTMDQQLKMVMSLLQIQFITGKTPFDQCFLNTDIEINCIGNETRIDGIMLELKELFHCDPAARHVVNEGGFDCRALTHVKEVEVSGRNIKDKASKAQAAFKRALKHYNDWSHMKDSVPSGQTIEDMALYIRKKLFLQFGGSKISKVLGAPKSKRYIQMVLVHRILCLLALLPDRSVRKKSLGCLGRWQERSNGKSGSKQEKGCEDQSCRGSNRSRWICP